MKARLRLFVAAALCVVSVAVDGAEPVKSEAVMEVATRVATRFMNDNPDVGATSYVGGKRRSSKIWTRSVFYEGLLNMYREEAREEWLDYAVRWGEFHKWVSSSDTEAKNANADFQCCGQAYLQLYMMEPEREERMAHIKGRIDDMIAGGRENYWWWIDAIQMSMPVMAMLGEITGDDAYHDYMWRLYSYTRDRQGGEKRGGGSALMNGETGLWYRDYQQDPPYKDLTEPDKDCYWSRGNGWVYMALARVMQFTGTDEAHRGDYERDFKKLSEGLLGCQREDGSWNVSLAAPSNWGSAGSEGPEMTGTSLFVGGMAWGVRSGLLEREKYLPAIRRGWESMVRAVHDDGFVGYMQGTGSKPEDGGPVVWNSRPDFDDFGTGCWLWGAAEVHALLAADERAEESGVEMLPAGDDAGPAEVYTTGGVKVGESVEGLAPGVYVVRRGMSVRKVAVGAGRGR